MAFQSAPRGRLCLLAFITALASLALAFASSGTALAARATAPTLRLDRTFGANGRAVASVDLPGQPWWEAEVRAAATADGGLVVADSAQVLRYDADGQLEAGFGDGGSAAIPVPSGGEFHLAGVVVDPAGRILVAGTVSFRDHPIPSPDSGMPTFTQPRVEALLARFAPDGRLDQTFGSGGSEATTFSLPAPENPKGQAYEAPSVWLTNVAIDSRGRVVLGGNFTRQVVECRDFSNAPVGSGYVVRLADNGATDASFGSGGTQVVEQLSTIHALAIDGSGRPFLAGPGNGGCESRPSVLVGLGSDGAVRPDVGSAGTAAFSRTGIAGLTVDRRGRVLVVGNPAPPRRGGSNGRFLHPHRSLTLVLRLAAGGQPDRSFGRAGVAKVLLPGPRSSFGTVLVGRGGTLLLGGTVVTNVAEGGSRSAFAALALRGTKRSAAVKPPSTVVTGFGARANAWGKQALLDAAGHLVLVGAVGNPALPTGEGIAIARYDYGVGR